MVYILIKINGALPALCCTPQFILNRSSLTLCTQTHKAMVSPARYAADTTSLSFSAQFTSRANSVGCGRTVRGHGSAGQGGRYRSLAVLLPRFEVKIAVVEKYLDKWLVNTASDVI